MPGATGQSVAEVDRYLTEQNVCGNGGLCKSRRKKVAFMTQHCVFCQFCVRLSYYARNANRKDAKWHYKVHT